LSTSLRISAATFLVAFGLSSGVSFAQVLKSSELAVSTDQIYSRKRISARESIVDARLGSDQIEDGKINDLYQQVVKIHLQGDYATAADKYRSLVIPMAERAQSDAIRKKFLFLGYRGLGNCYLAMTRFTEAEDMFQKLFEYLPTTPGTLDSDYAINFESIAMAQMGQQRWNSAEESLGKAVSIFDEQIGRAATSGSNAEANGRTDKLRMSQDMALNLFAVVYFREQRYAEALEILERAYNQGVTFRAPTEIVAQIVSDGRAVSMATGDVDAITTWSRRAPEAPLTR
jgi:tetratricopeptide (TPR) repeat protein